MRFICVWKIVCHKYWRCGLRMLLYLKLYKSVFLKLCVIHVMPLKRIVLISSLRNTGIQFLYNTY